MHFKNSKSDFFTIEGLKKLKGGSFWKIQKNFIILTKVRAKKFKKSENIDKNRRGMINWKGVQIFKENWFSEKCIGKIVKVIFFQFRGWKN